jgi:hypothetical protein
MTFGSISRVLFRPKPQPPAPVVHQMLPIKTYKPATAPVPKPIGPDSKVADLVECIGPGRYRIRIPKNRKPDLLTKPFDYAYDLTMARLMREAATGELDWPDGITAPPPKTHEERRAERLAVIRQVAESERDFKAMAFNEGFPVGTPWEEPSTEGRKEQQARRTARELLGLTRARIFGA